MSFLSSSLNPLSSGSGTSHTEFKPAALSYFTIFCPALTPSKAKDDGGDPDNDTAQEAAQILFYTSRARAAPKDRMLRQIGVAKGMVEFCSMMSGSSSTSDRSWNVHSSKRRMVLIQVEEGIWVHASIELPQTVWRDSLNGRTSREYHDSLLADAWLEESIHRAWRDWVLLNGSPPSILARKPGRLALERSLEKYFSVWAWSWDLEFASSTGQSASNNADHRRILAESIDGFSIVPQAPRSKLAKLMLSDTVRKLQGDKQRELVLLSDTSILWPPTNAGCLETEDEDEGQEISNDTGVPCRRMLHSQTKADILRRVVSHLTGLEREKDLVRATAASTLSEGKRRGTSGAIRNKSTANGNTKNKRDLRTGLGASNQRVVSTPVPQQRTASASSTASVSTLNESPKWSNWSGVLGGLGKIAFRGGDTPEHSSTPVVEEESVTSTALIHQDTGLEQSADIASNAYVPVVVAPAHGSVASTQVAGPFQLIQQRLSEAVPIQEASSKIWTGAGTAFKGLGASLGLSSSSLTNERSSSRQPANNLTADTVTEDRFADASVDISQTSADADASIVTKVSILEPEVDFDELSAALSTDAVDDNSDAAINEATKNILPQTFESNVTTNQLPANDMNLLNRTDDGNSSFDSASIRTGSSTKAFPSISVTSAAWYNAKLLKNDALIGELSSSPRLNPLGNSGHKQQSFAETPTKTAGNESLTDMETADTSISALSVQSEYHDFELDGWGPERPVPVQTFMCHARTEKDQSATDDSATVLETATFIKHRVAFTTRRLLTLVFIEREDDASTGPDAETLSEAWMLLRRVQRILNDHERTTKARVDEENDAVRFIHLDGATQTYQNTLDAVDAKLERDVLNVAEAHCLSALDLMKRHGVIEVFSRSSSGKTWTACRQSLNPNSENKGSESRQADQTFMIQAGKSISIVDCDNELRRLANVYPSFGI